MSKQSVMRILKQIQKNCDTDIERDGWGNLHRETCILHRYFQSIGMKQSTMPGCLGGEKPCSEMLRILGADTSLTHCPTIHKEIYDIAKNYKLPRNVMKI